jgi:subtilisin family serine protease
MKATILTLLALIMMCGLILIPQSVNADEQKNEPMANLAAVSSDTLVEQQWALPLIQSFSVEEQQEVIVAVLDTGIDTAHEDLAGKVIDSVNFSKSDSANDIQGHGTHIAGIIAANADNGIGVAGAAPNVKLLNVKIAEDNGIVWASSVAKGIIWATDNGAAIINMSLTVPSNYQPLEEAVEYALGKGVIMVAAAGNHVKALTYPAAYGDVIAVAATNPDGTVWAESNDGDFVDVYAPGVGILSTYPGNQYAFMSGSSMATAYVTAVTALVYNQIDDANGNGRICDETAELVGSLFNTAK